MNQEDNSILVEFEVKNNVAFITLNRPEVYNSINQQCAFQIQNRLKDAENLTNVRCVVITGKGKAFCAGQDLNEVLDPNGPVLSEIVCKHYNPIIHLIRNLSKPVICAVNGVAAGAGANIALSGDIVIAKESASFVQAFSKIGLIPDSGGTFFLPRLVGWNRASALMMTGDKVSAVEALDMGMLYKVYPNADFEIEVLNLALKIAQMPTLALHLTKMALNESFNSNLDSQLNLEHKLQTQAGQSDDYQEGVQAFVQKRLPIFKGK